MSGRSGGIARRERRRFLQAGAAFALLGWLDALAPLRAFAGPRAERAPELARELAALFRSPEPARALGRRILALHPEAGDARRLRARLGAAAAAGDAGALRERFAELRSRDFARARIVRVDGWVLARCEAEVCALLGRG